ncbi:MAG: DUF2092 domain-containing protein [Syntrophobacteraceae bacterium]|nr:DUF2092 domain-containing protein [Syntrophobacteraceae bacterium]
MHRVKRIVISGIFFLAAVLAAVPLPAAEAPAAGASEPNPAMEQVMRMANFMAQLKEFSVTQQKGYDVVQESGQKIEFGERRKLTLVRPDRFRSEVERSDGESTMAVFDGKALTVFSPKQNMFASTEVKGDIDAAIKHFVGDLKMRLPLAMLWVTTLPKELEQRMLGADIVEISALQGTPCVHVAARGETVDFQVWIPTTGDPLPRRIVLTYKYEEGQPQFWANFSDWNTSPNPPGTLFSLDIPKDAQRIEFLSRVARANEPAKPAAKKGGKK